MCQNNCINDCNCNITPIVGPQGLTGVGITNVIKDNNNDIIVTLTNGVVINVGNIPNGVNGTNGINGINGTNGMSAYEIAVDNGYIGTENDWLNSLNGTDGIGVSSIDINGNNVEVTYTDNSVQIISSLDTFKGSQVVAGIPLGTSYDIPSPLNNWTEIVTTGNNPLGSSPNCWKITYCARIYSNMDVDIKLDGFGGTTGLTLGKIITDSLGKDIHMEILVSRRDFNTFPSWDISYNINVRDSIRNTFSTNILNHSSGSFESGTRHFKYNETGIGTIGGGVTLYKRINSGNTIGVDDRIAIIEKLKF